MKYGFAFLLVFIALGASPTAHADQAEAKEVARINNCPPKKIEIYQQSLGETGTTIYHVDCNLPKATGDKDSAAGPDALLISCDASLCELMRPVAAEKK